MTQGEGDLLNTLKPVSRMDTPDIDATLKPGDFAKAPSADKMGRRISWHEGDKFLDEFDDSHLWQHGNARCQKKVVPQ